MSVEAVISCPRCLRQYAVDPVLGGSLAQCHACKASFSIALAEIAGGEPVVTLTEPIEPRLNFMKEGCAELARNVADLLRMADAPVTPMAVSAVVESMPRLLAEIRDEGWRERPCGRAIKRAFVLDGHDQEARLDDLLRYFTLYMPGRSQTARDMLEGAFLGALSVEFDPPPIPIPPPERRRGPLERLAERMGW